MNVENDHSEEDTPERSADEAENHLPVPAPDPALTVSRKRLAGSATCLNCGTVLQGPFCHYCGQPDKNFLRFFPVLLRELMEDFLDFDSRFMRTMKPLLFIPGKLTRDYLDGRRFRYTPPLRLYLFTSIACFFLATLFTSDVIQIDANSDKSDGASSGVQIDEIDSPKVAEAISRLDPKTREEVEKALEGVKQAPEETEPEVETISINGKPWDRETNPLIIGWMPDWVNNWINDEIEQSPQKGKQIEENPDLIKDKVFDVLPATMFVLLPIVALLFKFWYLFAKKYYVEHLIFALHNHAFIFVMLLIGILAGAVAEWADPAGQGFLTRLADWIEIAIMCWIPLYLLISLKRVYRQGWAMTLAKFSVIGISYTILLALTTAFVALLSFVLL